MLRLSVVRSDSAISLVYRVSLRLSLVCLAIDYPYEEGGIMARIEYWEKNIAKETCAQLKRSLKFRDINPTDIERIDIMTGCDAGGGAFVAGARLAVTVTVKPGTKYPPGEETFTFEITVAEIICKEDCTDLLSRTIKDKLTEGLQTIAENELHIYIDKNDEIQCTYDAMPTETKCSKSIKLKLYVVKDLAYYAMILGKEAMSGHWCHLCKLSHKQFSDLLTNGDA